MIFDSPFNSAAQSIEAQTQTQRWDSPAINPRKVLVADDESLAAMALMQCLKQLGYAAVGPARDGVHAIELAFASQPDLALLDVRMMTESDGIDAARAMFSELLIPVVIVSAYSDAEQVASAADAGIFGYLVKPVTKDQLRPAIEVAWARFRQYMAKDVEADGLRKKFRDRQSIEHAKWVVVERESVDESEAMRRIRRRARATGQSLSDVAHEILSGEPL